MKKIALISIFCAACLALTGCGSDSAQNPQNRPDGSFAPPEFNQNQPFEEQQEQEAEQTASQNCTAQVEDVMSLTAEKKSEKADIPENSCSVNFSEQTMIDGEGCWLEEGVLLITKGGTYTLSGSFTGKIYIETDENIMLVLDNLSVSSPDGPAIYCFDAKNLYIKLADGSENVIADSAEYTFTGTNESKDEDEPNATIFSKCDLVFCGNGSLSVSGNYNNAISGKDDLTFESGKISVTAVNNGIRGKDSVAVIEAELTVDAAADAIKSSNDTDEGKGYIIISGGSVDIKAGEDGIQAETDLLISGGKISVKTTGDVAQSSDNMGRGHEQNNASTDNDLSSKGIKSGNVTVISEAEVKVNSTDHCLHTGAELYIKSGTLELESSRGKGISSHSDLTIDGGSFTIYGTEGIESKAILTVNGGDFDITATDDGLNSGGGSDSFGMNQASTQSHDLFINGGNITIDAQGDGIDSNGNMTISGGTVFVNGPTNGGNGSLDCGDGGFTISVSGGTLFASGSLGMVETPSASATTQYTLAFATDTSLDKGTTLEIRSSSGAVIFSYELIKSAQHFIFSSSEIASGEAYTLYADGAECGSVTASDIVSGDTGTGMGGLGGGGMHGGFGGGQPPQEQNGGMPPFDFNEYSA